jgi:hypothetical protein
MPMIDKKINLKTMKKNSPEFYIWMNNIISCSMTQNHIKEIVKHKCPKLKVTDEEITHQIKLYNLLNAVKRTYV